MSLSVDSKRSCGEVTGPALGVAGNQGPQGSEFIFTTTASCSRWCQPMVVVIMWPVPQCVPGQRATARCHLPLC